MINIKRIKTEVDIVVGGLYFETMQNGKSDNCVINFIRSRIAEKPIDYPDGGDEYLKGTRWVKTHLVFDDEVYEGDIQSLRDMGVTDKPHNDHKLYRIMKGTSIKELEKLTYRQLKSLTE